FSYDQEATNLPESKSIENQWQAFENKHDEAQHRALTGLDLDRILDASRESFRFLGRVQNTRNTRIAERLVARLRSASQPERMFIRLGESHSPIVDSFTKLARKIKRPTLIQI